MMNSVKQAKAAFNHHFLKFECLRNASSNAMRGRKQYQIRQSQTIKS